MSSSANGGSWDEQLRSVRERMAAPGVALPADLRGRSGVQFLEAIGSGQLPSPPIGHTLDIWPIEWENGRTVFQGLPATAHYNPLGSVHGGWIATMLDSAVGCAIHSMLPAGKGYTTLELKVNYVRPVTTATGALRAEGKVIHAGGQVATAEGRLYDTSGKLYAHATTTCLIFSLPSQSG
ncbi:MAG TPA: PaaI family thioesterase [Burkholderiales bacterium]|nr:PaaI family thioesterase [Burkholderiales bacterium]